MTHFDMPDEAKLTRGIEDVKINRWEVVKTSIDPSWSSSLNVPSSLNTIPSIKAKFVASTESLFVGNQH